MNKKEGFQNCYFILEGKVETRVGRENMKLIKTKYSDLNFSFLDHILKKFLKGIENKQMISIH